MSEGTSEVDPLLPWRNLYELYCGTKYQAGEDHRRFRAWTGVSPQVAEKIWVKYKHSVWMPECTHLLIVLHFLKVMPTEDLGAAQFQFGSRNTYRKYLWRTLGYLNDSMTEINIEDRFSGPVPTSGLFANIAMIIDGTDCPVDRPFASKEERLKFFSGRSKDNQYSKYNLKYTVGVQIATGKIVAVFGPDFGSVHDITAVKHNELIAQIVSWNPFEIILADKGYQGLFGCLSPIKGSYLTPSEDAFNEVLSSVRQMVECVLHRVKIFGALGSCGRFHCNIEKHSMIFNVACQITNISMEREPVWQNINYYL